jgi:hypothetical protein
MRFVLFIFVLACMVSCQSGRIPCPEPVTAKVKRSVIHKHYRDSEETLSAKADENKPRTAKAGKNSVRVISSVSAEEWDCPQPGRKKYMPRSVKQNIRRNLKKIKAGDTKADSLQATPR